MEVGLVGDHVNFHGAGMGSMGTLFLPAWVSLAPVACSL